MGALIVLDRNGYNASIVQEPSDYPRCYLCGRTSGKLDRHEIFGAANRSKSKLLGLWVNLCRNCHRMAHGEQKTSISLKRAGQRAAMERYGWSVEQFIAEIGKNYLE